MHIMKITVEIFVIKCNKNIFLFQQYTICLDLRIHMKSILKVFLTLMNHYLYIGPEPIIHNEAEFDKHIQSTKGRPH